jgi:hypothetical protein
MAETPAGFSGRRTVPVSLRSDGGRSFIADLELQFVDGVPSALVHDGRRYAFSRTLPATWSEGSAPGHEMIYVFEADPDAAV